MKYYKQISDGLVIGVTTKIENGYVIAPVDLTTGRLTSRQKYVVDIEDTSKFTPYKLVLPRTEVLERVMRGLINHCIFEFKNHGLYEDVAETATALRHSDQFNSTSHGNLYDFILSNPTSSEIDKYLADMQGLDHNFEFNWDEDLGVMISLITAIVHQTIESYNSNT